MALSVTVTTAAPHDIFDPAAPDNFDGLGLVGDNVAPGKCPRHDWCLKDPGHRGNCRRYPDGDPRTKKAGSTSGAKPGPARKPGAAPPRRSRSRPNMLPAVWSFVYGQAGAVVEHTAPEPAGPPVGRVMQFQAPLAGARLHGLLSKLPIYQQATALAGGGMLEDIMELIAAPLVVGVMATSEQARDYLWPILATSLQSSAVQIAKMQKEQADAMESVNEFSADAAAIMEQMAASLFAPRYRPEPDEGGQADGAPAG